MARRLSAKEDYNQAFLSTNRNKKSVTLNLKTKPGSMILKSLVKASDILIKNWRPGSMDWLGIGYKDLEKLNPGLINCSINGFGRDGPYSKRSAFDWIIQAIGRGMATTGAPQGDPQKVGFPVVDLSLALFGTI